jgi:hypothetical protein
VAPSARPPYPHLSRRLVIDLEPSSIQLAFCSLRRSPGSSYRPTFCRKRRGELRFNLDTRKVLNVPRRSPDAQTRPPDGFTFTVAPGLKELPGDSRRAPGATSIPCRFGMSSPSEDRMHSRFSPDGQTEASFGTASPAMAAQRARPGSVGRAVSGRVRLGDCLLPVIRPAAFCPPRAPAGAVAPGCVTVDPKDYCTDDGT